MKDTSKLGELRTTGQMRTMLANAAKAVMQGTLEIDRAVALHKLAKNVSDSLYSETKITMFRNEIGQTIEKFGEMPIGDPSDNSEGV